MKKLTSRIIPLIVSALILLSTIPVGAFATEKVTANIVTDLSTVSGLDKKIADKTQNIVKGYSAAPKGTGMSYSIEQTYGTVTNENINSSGRYLELVTDGDLTTSHADSNSFRQIPEAGKYVEGYVDFTFTFPSTAEIINLLVASSTTTSLTTQAYEVYVSKELSTLYSSDNMVCSYTNTNDSTGQYITFSSTIEAAYLGIRVTGLVSKTLSNYYEYSYCRIREIAVIGSCEIPEKYRIIDEDAAKGCIDALKTESNILQSGYGLSDVAVPSSIMVYGANAGVPVREGRVSGNYLLDGDVSTNADVVLNAVTFLDSENNFVEGSYINVVFVLKEKADIDKIFLAQREEIRFMAHKYEIYIGNNINELFNAENCYWSFTNETNARYQTFTAEKTVSAKLVGFRFIEPVTLPDFNLEAFNAYPRLTEIAIFGKYNQPYYDYTVSSNYGDFVSDSGNAEEETALTYTVPLTKDGYSFIEWQLNGKAVESDIDLANNTSTVSVSLMENTTLTAVYENDPTSFSGTQFGIKNGKVRLPVDTIAYEAVMGFEQQPLNIAVKDGDRLYRGGEYITDGMQLVLYAAGEVAETLDIVTEYDYNSDKQVNVTDISAAIDGILGNSEFTEEGKFAFDGNSSGVITVSDIVGARETILNIPENPTDYSSQTIAMKDFKYKQMGRNYLNSDGSLYIEMAAAGFSFKADCYGDVMATVNNSYSGTNYYTVVVDGEVKDIPVTGGGQQDITLARGLPKGKHTIEFYRCEQAGTSITVNAFKLNGVNLDAPENSDLYIEFIGDSITSGSGNMVANGVEINGRRNNGYLAYGTMTARELSADWSNVSLSGGTLTNQTDSSGYLPQIYKQQVATKPDSVYDFSRKADIVVINLGTNDQGRLDSQYSNIADRSAVFKAELDSLVDYILENNGKNTKIVFAYGLMTPNESFIDEVYRTTAAELQQNGTSAYHIRMTTRKNGGNGHPNIYDNVEASKELADFINKNVLG